MFFKRTCFSPPIPTSLENDAFGIFLKTLTMRLQPFSLLMHTVFLIFVSVLQLTGKGTDALQVGFHERLLNIVSPS